MKDVRKLYQICAEALRGIGMDISPDIVKVSVNGRLSRALGRCKRTVGYGWERYEIEFQPCILADGIDDHIPMEVIMHELIHTCPGCMNHGYEWKRRADRVNRMLGYNVSRLVSSEMLVANGVKLKEAEDKYAAVCLECGKTVKTWKRWSSTCESIENYRHGGSCGGGLKVVGINGYRC